MNTLTTTDEQLISLGFSKIKDYVYSLIFDSNYINFELIIDISMKNGFELEILDRFDYIIINPKFETIEELKTFIKILKS